MKLRSLDIQHFGHFADFRLTLDGGNVAIVHGLNEAGKSTLLEFLRQMLFGFAPERNHPYEFGGGGELKGAARFVLSDFREVEITRRKGRKRTIQVWIDGAERDLDEDGFNHLLGHVTKPVFESVFAFGLDELRRGNEALSHESLQSALFGGGLGGAFNPETLLAEFETEAGELFKPAASKPSINALCKEIGNLSKEVKRLAIRSDDFEQRRQAHEQAQASSEHLKQAVAELRLEYGRLDTLSRALEPWLNLRTLRAERQSLVVPTGFPHDARHQFQIVTQTCERLTAECANLKDEIADAEAQLAEIQLDKTLLPLKAEIEACHLAIQSVADARRDLPQKCVERETLEREIVSSLNELRPGWSFDDLREFRIDAATQRAIQTLRGSHAELTRQRQDWLNESARLTKVVDQASADLASLGEPDDILAVADIVERSGDYVANQKELLKLRDKLTQLERTRELQLARLRPLLSAGPADVARLPVPRKEQVEQFDGAFRTVQGRLETARAACHDQQQQLENLETQLRDLDSDRRSVPKLDELQERRTRRDVGWSLIRSQFIDGVDRAADLAVWSGSNASPADEYEACVAGADRIADAVYDNADTVARREQLQQHIFRARDLLARKRDDERRVEDDLRQIKQQWNELWRPCGIAPDTPAVMTRWLDDHTRYVELARDHSNQQIEASSLQQRVADFESALRAALLSPDGDASRLLTLARHRVETAKETALQRKNHERDRKRAEKELAAIQSSLQDSSTYDNWVVQWQFVLKRLALPLDWEVELASQVIERLRTTQTKLSSLTDLSGRIAAMEARIREFDPQVRKICEALQQPVDTDRPEVTARLLHERLNEASRAEARRSGLDSTLAEKRRQLRAKQHELQSANQQRERLLSSGSAASDAEFLATAGRAEHAAVLDQRIAELQRQVELLRGNADPAEFEARLRDSDPVLLQAHLQDLSQELKSREDESHEAAKRAGEAQQLLREMDGRDDAARLQEQLAGKQAALTTNVHRYVPLIFARKLLQDAIKRFERQNQPEMIGSISRLLCTMTGGRYVEIERPASDHNTIYVRRYDGADRTPDQLSTGTREQLYLAIRLGYILHYCRQAEPLPIVMDDVLANFDANRARLTLEALRDVAREVQVLFFTCHTHCSDLIRDVFPDSLRIDLPDGR